MVTFKNDEKWKKQANQAANEERIFWLAKKAFTGWVEQMEKLRQRNNLYKVLEAHYLFTIKKRAVESLKIYVNFKLEQRYNDLVIVNEVVKIRQRSVLQSWHRIYTKRLAVKRLVCHSEKAIKGIVVRGIIQRYNYQNSVIVYMQSQRQHYIELTALNRLKLSVEKRKNIENALEVIDSRKEHWAMKKNFTLWLKKYRALKKTYTTYAFIAVNIKNVIAKDCFNSLKLYAKYQKNKRLADSIYQKSLTQKLFNTINNLRITSDKDYDASSKIMTKQIYKIKSQTLKGWNEVFKKVQSERVKVESFVKTKQVSILTDVLTQWRDYSKHQTKINRIYKELKAKTDNDKVERGFSRFQKGIEIMKLTKAKNAKADQFYRKNTFKNIKNAWMVIVIKNRSETSRVVKLRNALQRKLITKCWDVMMKKTETQRAKIRYIRKVTKIPAKIEYRLCLQKWKKFVIYERDLQNKVQQGIEYFNQKRISAGFYHLLENHKTI